MLCSDPMSWKIWFLSCCLFAPLPVAAAPQASAQKPVSHLDDGARNVDVPAQVAALLRPILDEEQKGT